MTRENMFEAIAHEEVIQVLKEIADDCSERSRCDRCKFRYDDKYGGCVLSGKPDEWKLDKHISGKE